MVETDNSGNLKLLIAFVGGGAAITACVIALQGLYLNFEWNADVQRSGQPNVELQAVRAEHNGELAKYRPVAGEVKDPKVTPEPAIGIPIEKAMKLVIAEHAGQGPKPAVKAVKPESEAKEKKPDAKH